MELLIGWIIGIWIAMVAKKVLMYALGKLQEHTMRRWDAKHPPPHKNNPTPEKF